jgi:hypothetical protein
MLANFTPEALMIIRDHGLRSYQQRKQWFSTAPAVNHGEFMQFTSNSSLPLTKMPYGLQQSVSYPSKPRIHYLEITAAELSHLKLIYTSRAGADEMKGLEILMDSDE